MGNRKLRTSMGRFFKDYEFELVLKPNERTFDFQKRVEDESGEGIDLLFGYPYILLSDTLQRMIFYTIAIESNEDSTLIFEEPESHAFPDYTSYLGKKIAFDEKNQYFVATHDPYLFLAILEKAPKNDVNVFITYFEDYQTKVKCLNDEEVSKIMVYDPFSNLDYFLGRLDSFVSEEDQ
jgi:predicted ATPase